MCVHLFNSDHLRITLQSSDLFWGTKFHAPSPPLPSLIFFYLQAITHGFLWWWASSRLFFSLKWRLQSSFSFSIPLPLNFKKQRTPLMKKIQGLQVPHGATSYIMIYLVIIKLINNKINSWWDHYDHCALQLPL